MATLKADGIGWMHKQIKISSLTWPLSMSQRTHSQSTLRLQTQRVFVVVASVYTEWDRLLVHTHSFNHKSTFRAGHPCVFQHLSRDVKNHWLHAVQIIGVDTPRYLSSIICCRISVLCSAVFNQFEPVNQEIVGQLKPSGSPNYVLPPGFFKEVFPTLRPAVLGAIPTIYKHAVVQLLVLILTPDPTSLTYFRSVF